MRPARCHPVVKVCLIGKLPSLVGLLGNKKYFCGNLVTYADFAMYTIMDLIRLVEPDVIKKYSVLVKWMARIESLPGVKVGVAVRCLL